MLTLSTTFSGPNTNTNARGQKNCTQLFLWLRGMPRSMTSKLRFAQYCFLVAFETKAETLQTNYKFKWKLLPMKSGCMGVMNAFEQFIWSLARVPVKKWYQKRGFKALREPASDLSWEVAHPCTIHNVDSRSTLIHGLTSGNRINLFSKQNYSRLEYRGS